METISEKRSGCWAVVAEAGRSLSLRPAWSTELVTGQPELHRKTMSRKKNKTKQNKNYFPCTGKEHARA